MTASFKLLRKKLFVLSVIHPQIEKFFKLPLKKSLQLRFKLIVTLNRD